MIPGLHTRYPDMVTVDDKTGLACLLPFWLILQAIMNVPLNASQQFIAHAFATTRQAVRGRMEFFYSLVGSRNALHRKPKIYA